MKFNLSLAVLIAAFTFTQAPSASAIVEIGLDPSDIQRLSEVSTEVTYYNDFTSGEQAGKPNDTVKYNYTVHNTSPAPFIIDGGFATFNVEIGPGANEVWPLIVDYEIPLPADLTPIVDVGSPVGWAHEFLTAAEYEAAFGESNPFGAANILHWYSLASGAGTNVGPVGPDPTALSISPDGYTSAIGPGTNEGQLSNFILYSTLQPVAGPYLTSWLDEYRNIGDPPLPFDQVGGGGTIPYQQSSTAVPEPSTFILFGMGIFAAIFKLRRSH